MKIIEAIQKIDEFKPNAYTNEHKIDWLSTIDRMVWLEVIKTHEDAGEEEFEGYNQNTDTETELLVPAPFDELYLSWLESKIDYTNGEYGKYNNSAATFNADYSNFRNWYNRNHMPLNTNLHFF